MTDPTERERLARLLFNQWFGWDAWEHEPQDSFARAKCYANADEILAEFVREGAPRTPAPAVDLLAAGRRAMHRYRSICGKWKVEHGEAWMPAERIEELWRSVAAAALSELHNSHPSLDRSAAKSSESVAGKSAGRGEGET